MRMLTRLQVAPVAAEFLGTATLVMVALVLTETTAVSYFVATSLAITVATIVLLFGSISGGHFNPAVTFGMWSARLMGTLRSITYIAAQLLGGLVAWQLYQYLTDRHLPAKTVTFSTHIWVAELVGAMILTLGITAALSRGYDALQSAITYGAALFVAIMIAATASAGYLNPAIALGERSWGSAYVLGPLVGGLIGVNLYTMLFSSNKWWRK